MLYITTRSGREAFTPAWPLKSARASDGGMFLPFGGFQAEEFTQPGASFADLTAAVLGRFFRKELRAEQIEEAVGSCPIDLSPLGQRVLVAQLWHNPAGEYRFLESRLLELLGAERKTRDGWPGMAVRVAVLLFILGNLKDQGLEQPDISGLCADFGWIAAARYVRSWGADIRNIVCVCNENQSLWELVTHGQLRTDTVALSTGLPEADQAVPAQLERLIQECGGAPEVTAFLDAKMRGGVYCPEAETLEKMRRGMEVSVVSSRRVEDIIRGVWRTNGYQMAPATALAYGGLLDYRAKTGMFGPAVVLAEKRSSR